jgi:hypothetical protein
VLNIFCYSLSNSAGFLIHFVGEGFVMILLHEISLIVVLLSGILVGEGLIMTIHFSEGFAMILLYCV